MGASFLALALGVVAEADWIGGLLGGGSTGAGAFTEGLTVVSVDLSDVGVVSTVGILGAHVFGIAVGAIRVSVTGGIWFAVSPSTRKGFASFEAGTLSAGAWAMATGVISTSSPMSARSIVDRGQY